GTALAVRRGGLEVRPARRLSPLVRRAVHPRRRSRQAPGSRGSPSSSTRSCTSPTSTSARSRPRPLPPPLPLPLPPQIRLFPRARTSPRLPDARARPRLRLIELDDEPDRRAQRAEHPASAGGRGQEPRPRHPDVPRRALLALATTIPQAWRGGHGEEADRGGGAIQGCERDCFLDSSSDKLTGRHLLSVRRAVPTNCTHSPARCLSTPPSYDARVIRQIVRPFLIFPYLPPVLLSATLHRLPSELSLD
ncbi:hypothetical protein FB451DRAFT_1558631, partial [Mycena latifolia]